MNTLYTRLSIALLFIVIVTGGALFTVNLLSTRNYYEEITQRLNASIAMYVTDQSQLIEDGVVNQPALATLAQQAMVINPTVEVYLLDTFGRILGHGTPDDLLVDQIDLVPVRELLAGDARMPLRGMDPRSNREKVFSAWPVMQGTSLQGYLYAILGGQKYDALANDIRGSYVQQVSLGALLAILATAFGVGLLVFGLLTRRLARLTRQVRLFTESGFDPSLAGSDMVTDRTTEALAADAAHSRTERGDEIDQLQTAFNHMSGKITQQFEELKETDRLRRELISNVSHDLRTPLSSMHGYVETLLIKDEELSAEERRRYLQITRKHSQHLEKLIAELFELSKLEAAAIKPQLESFSLAELLHDVMQEFMLDAAEKRITLAVDGELDNSSVHADISLVQRVLENLLRNAIRHTPEGGTVTIRLEPRPDCVGVSVEDTGCGIADKDLDRVFDRFYRSEREESRVDDSAGLGLAIVQKILDLHGSRISVSSQLNIGTTFAFNLPSARAA
ncbi:MAG: HAMP domain-containing histidine kinase [Gammaproteobacteria bacterium]|nr:HAMP domain-containing histidine kinase [Gammaproteobacteria bacterium]